jgi:hypothetical protein
MRTHLEGACRWADVLILGDQMSTDSTRAIAREFGDQVRVVDNPGVVYDEGERQRIVFEEARKLFPGEPRILMAIDADEILSANYRTSQEWQEIQKLPPGSGIYAEWVNIDPGFKTWFPFGGAILIGVVDEEKIAYSAGKYHVPRLVQAPSAPRFYCKEIKLLHYQYADAARSQSKNRSYQVQEWIDNPTRPIRLFRRFNAALATAESSHQPIRDEWVRGFADEGVRWDRIEVDGVYRWDREVLEAILKHGPRFFRRLDIWDVNWEEIAQLHGVPLKGLNIHDPRSFSERRIHQWLRKTQPQMGSSITRLVQRALRVAGW